MKSTIFSSVLLSSFVGYLASQQAEARMTPNMVDRSLSDLARVEDGHLHILTKRNNEASVNNAHKKHRRHHSRKEKRATCSSGSSSSSSSSADDDDESVSNGSAAVRNASGTSSKSSSSSRSGSGSSSSSSSPAASTATSRNKSTSSSGSSSSSSGSSSGSSSSGSGSSSSSSGSSSSSSDDDSSSSASGSASSLAAITGFQGTNTGIGSWFRTNSGQDSTNGRSWCQLNYQDSWMGFAPSVGTMLKNFGSVTDTAGKAYCGREARATNPSNGKTALIYIVDGFDDKWVLSPGSIDLTMAAFEALYGSSPNDNKNTVIKDLEWEFTGNVKEEYTFNASG